MKFFRGCLFFVLFFLSFFSFQLSSTDSLVATENITQSSPNSFNTTSEDPSCLPHLNDHFGREERILIHQDPESLHCLVKTSDQEIEIIPESEEINLRRPLFPPRPPLPIFLKLVATVTPPPVGDHPFGATDVVFHGRYAVVTYNTQGDTYLGAIQIIDLINPRHPILLFQLIFRDRDLNTALIENQSLYLVGAESQDVTGFPTPAEIQKVNLDAMFLPITFLPPIPLPSYTATDLVALNDSLFVTTGNTGGLVRLDQSTLTQNGFIPLADARSIAIDKEENKVYVFQGTPGRMTVIDPNNLSYQTHWVGGATLAESKGSIEISDDLVFIGAGDGGALIVSKSGRLLGTIPNPNDPRLPPEKRVTNAVSVDHRVVMLANGEAGVRIAYWWVEGRRIRSFILGKLNFGDYFGAVNGVNYKGKYLLVAAGISGLKIVEVELHHPFPRKLPRILE